MQAFTRVYVNSPGSDNAATLRNASNATVDSCSWKTVAAAVNC